MGASALMLLISSTAVQAGVDPDSSGTSSPAKTAAPASKVATGKPAIPKDKELVQTYLPTWLELGGQVRGRMEGPFGVGLTPGLDDVYYASRMRFDVGVRPASWIRFFAQAQDSRALGYDSGPVPASIYDPWDLRLAYVDIKPYEALGLQLRVGRQEIQVGSGRLIAAPEWSNIGKSFDAARLSFTVGGVKADFLGGSVVQCESTRFDHHKPGEHVYGGDFSLKGPVPGMVIEPYVIARTQIGIVDERGLKGNSHLYSGGGRIFGQMPAHFDYSAEVIEQWGYASSDKISALAGAYSVGWTAVAYRWKPRLSFEVNHASGDEANKDGYRNTFDQLYAGLHALYGITDQAGERNSRQYKAAVEATVSKKLKLSADVRGIYLATVQDGFYNVGGTRTVLNRNATSNHVGTELDLQAVYQLPHGVNLGLGFGNIFAGSYLKQSGKSGYSYPYIMWSKRF